MIWKPQKKDSNRNTKHNGRPLPADYNKWKTESQHLKIKWKLKEKLNSY
jgi:hypothetical protein